MKIHKLSSLFLSKQKPSFFKIKPAIAALTALVLLAGCQAGTVSGSLSAQKDAATVSFLNTAANGTDSEMTNTAVMQNNKAAIDDSHSYDGYVRVRYFAATSKKIKAQLIGPRGVTYTYNVTPGKYYAALPLSEGNGAYKVTLFENVVSNRYATVLSADFNVSLTSKFAPFLHPNQYVNYACAPNTVKKAAALAGNQKDSLSKIKPIYRFVVSNISYDTKKAATVQSGYLPQLDTVLRTKKGICFDYASLMTAMLRSQGVPCMLVVGYAGTVYHAWINVYSPSKGWINGVIYFNGTTWGLMDPTFASTGKQSKSVMSYIGDTSHYSAKFLY